MVAVEIVGVELVVVVVAVVVVVGVVVLLFNSSSLQKSRNSLRNSGRSW